MNWWQTICANTALGAFIGLKDSSPEVQKKAKAIAKKIFDAIRLVWPDDPDFK